MFQEGAFDLDSLAASLEEEPESMSTPFQNVFFMECSRMNGLLKAIILSLEVSRDMCLVYILTHEWLTSFPPHLWMLGTYI